MRGPLEKAEELKSLYIKYVNSAFPFQSAHLIKERQELLEKPGVIAHEPFIEPVRPFEGNMTLDAICEKYKYDPDFAEFIRIGLFPDSKRDLSKLTLEEYEKTLSTDRDTSKALSLYQHQVEALKAVCTDHKHMIVTTGTGSGKTECLFLPIIKNLLDVSKSWQGGKTPAVRALFLYPLTALADDLLARFRKSVNSQGAR